MFFCEGLFLVIVVVNNDGYMVEWVIYGEMVLYNDIVSWNWIEFFSVLGVINYFVFCV